jgi:ribosomal-protein-alanine N-acetyltransferase
VTEARDPLADRDAAAVYPPGGLGTDPVYLRTPSEADRDEFLTAMRRSRDLHHPWIQPPLTEAGFRLYLQRLARDDHAGFLICRRDDRAILGVVNLNNIVHGAFLSASLGYYAVADTGGAGHMTCGLRQVVAIAFDAMGLHRVEANIQPGNGPSIALVRRALGARLRPGHAAAARRPGGRGAADPVTPTTPSLPPVGAGLSGRPSAAIGSTPCSSESRDAGIREDAVPSPGLPSIERLTIAGKPAPTGESSRLPRSTDPAPESTP